MNESKVGSSWGVDSNEQNLAYPCDRFIKHYDAMYYRGVTIHASPKTIFRWLCQLRVAPYSYDLIDNFGRRSPKSLTPGMDNLVIGQLIRNRFRLVDYEKNKHITVLLTHKQRSESRFDHDQLRLFGEIAISYLIIPHKIPNSCRLLVKLIVQYPTGIIGRLMTVFLPWGDKIMMRKQLLNLMNLSEKNTSR
jgi:hypothetical protein